MTMNKNIYEHLWDYLWTFMLKIINTKRSSLAAGAKGNDYALTVLTECFVWHTENTESTECTCCACASLRTLCKYCQLNLN